MLGAWAGAALAVTAAWSLGRWLLRRMDLPPTIHFACGSALLSVAVFLLLAAGQGKPAALIALSLAALLPLVFLRPKIVLPAKTPLWASLALCIYGGLYLIFTLTPEIQSDALHYHLALAVSAKETGRFPPRIGFYDLIPQGVETLFAIAYAMGGDRAARLVHFAFLAASVPLIVEITTLLRLPLWSGWAAALFYLITPVVGVSGTCAYNDAAMVFAILAAFELLLLWWERWDDRLLWPLGIIGGFCYAIKFTGGLIAPVSLLVVLLKRRNLASLRIVVAACAIAGPWVIRASVLTGDPVFPLLNRIFPNPFFHLESELRLAEYLKDYGGVPLGAIPLELTLYGHRLQGLLGPAWLMLPIALLALRRRQGRILWLAALLAAAPWLLNIGTRFLMPALPFLALALMISLPRKPALALLTLHAILSWPAVLPSYYHVGAWVLHREIPLFVAMGLDDAQVFRLKMSFEHNVTKMIESHTQPGDRILDLANAPAAITHRDLVNAWQTALGDRLVHGLKDGLTAERGLLSEFQSRFAERQLTAVRIRFNSRLNEPVALHEIELRNGKEDRPAPNILWSTTAWPNPWETPQALDGNRISKWSTWQPVQPGMFYDLDFSSRVPIASIRLVASGSMARVRVELFGKRDAWTTLPLAPPAYLPALNLRRTAIRAVQREGIQYILTAGGEDTFGQIAEDFRKLGTDWGLEQIAAYENYALYRIRENRTSR